MNHKAVISALMALSLMSADLAFAQGFGNRNDRGQNNQGQRDGDQDRRDNQVRQPDRGQYREQPRDQYRGRPNIAQRDQRDERGAGPDHDFRRGGRLPSQYRSSQYVVDDWRGHHLSAPPRGYHWVQTGSDYVLIAIATGIIASIFLSQY